MSELDGVVLQHVAQRPANPLVLIPTTSHTVDFAAAQLCSLRTAGWQPAAVAVCWDRSACSALRTARLPAVLDEVAVLAERRGGGEARGTGAHPATAYVPKGVFDFAGRTLQWLKFYLLRRVTAALAGTRVPLFVVDADILWLRPAARSLVASCVEQGLEPRAPNLQLRVCPSTTPCTQAAAPSAQVRGGGAGRGGDGGWRHERGVCCERQRGRHPLAPQQVFLVVLGPPLGSGE